MEIACSKVGTSVSHTSYVSNLLNERGLRRCKLAKMPIDVNCKSKTKEKLEIVGIVAQYPR